MASKANQAGWKLSLAKEYLRSNPQASNEQVVKAIDVSPRTVTEARRQLVEAGEAKPAFYDRTSTPAAKPSALPPSPSDSAGPAEPKSLTPEDLQRLLAAASADKGEPLTSDEMRQTVSAIVRQADSQQIQIAAINLLAKLDAMLGSQQRLGPGPPLTHQGRVHRTALILEAGGLPVVRDALKEAGYDAIVYLKGRMPAQYRERTADEATEAPLSGAEGDQSADALHRQVG